MVLPLHSVHPTRLNSGWASCANPRARRAVSSRSSPRLFPYRLVAARSHSIASNEGRFRSDDGRTLIYDLFLTALPLVGGIAWLAAYVLIIRQSALDKINAMPMLAACSNISWEFWAGMHPGFFSAEMKIVNLLWLSVDVIILAQVVIYFPRAYPNVSQLISRGAIILSFIACFILTHFLFEEKLRISDTAALQNTLMSALFLHFLWARRGMAGQSLAIGWSKFVGTAAIWSWMVLLAEPQSLAGSLVTLMVLSSALDLLYIVGLYAAKRGAFAAPEKSLA